MGILKKPQHLAQKVTLKSKAVKNLKKRLLRKKDYSEEKITQKKRLLRKKDYSEEKIT